MERAVTPTGNIDWWMVVHARALGAVLISNNISDFERVRG